MNRQERRRQEKAGVSQPSIMQQYRKEAYDAGFDAGARSVVEITFYMTCYTLTYKTEYSKEQIQELARAIYNNIDSYRTGQLGPADYDEIVRMMNEEYEIKIT